MEVTISGGEKMAELSRRFRKLGRKDLKQGMTRAIKAEAEPLVVALRCSIRSTNMGLGAKTSGSSGIRDRVARGIKLRVRTSGRQAGIRLEVVGAPGEENMPRHIDKGEWRRMVYGHRDRWVNQRAERGWWTATINTRVPATRARISQLFDALSAVIGD